MATSESYDENILDAESFNWRLIVYPLLAALIIVIGGLAYYYNQQNERDKMESAAREGMVQAKTPEELIKVADQYPKADQGILALLSAGAESFSKRDFAAATQAYQRVAQSLTVDGELRDSALLGLASSLEASGKSGDAIKSYLEVARRGVKSPYAPFAYNTVARIYEESGDKDSERKILTEAVGLGSDSPFVKQAQFKLKELTLPPVPVAPKPTASASPSPAILPSANSVPVSVAPTPAKTNAVSVPASSPGR